MLSGDPLNFLTTIALRPTPSQMSPQLHLARRPLWRWTPWLPSGGCLREACPLFAFSPVFQKGQPALLSVRPLAWFGLGVILHFFHLGQAKGPSSLGGLFLLTGDRLLVELYLNPLELIPSLFLLLVVLGTSWWGPFL